MQHEIHTAHILMYGNGTHSKRLALTACVCLDAVQNSRLDWFLPIAKTIPLIAVV